MLVGPDGAACFRTSIQPPAPSRVSFFRYDDDKVGNEPVAACGVADAGFSCLWRHAAIGPDDRVVVAAAGEDGYPLTAIDEKGNAVATFVRSDLDRAKRSLEDRQRMTRLLAEGTGRPLDVARIGECGWKVVGMLARSVFTHTLQRL